MELFALQARPIFKRRRFADGKAFQEFAFVYRDSPLQPLCTYPICQAGELSYVQAMVALGVELDHLPADQQEGWVDFPVADHFSQVRQGVAQVAAGGAVGPIRPQQQR